MQRQSEITTLVGLEKYLIILKSVVLPSQYMEIQFDLGGDPSGGRIANCTSGASHVSNSIKDLLEKSRIVNQAPGERNFHSCFLTGSLHTSNYIIVYLLASGAPQDIKSTFKMLPKEQYHYLNQGNAYNIEGQDERKEFESVVVHKTYFQLVTS